MNSMNSRKISLYLAIFSVIFSVIVFISSFVEARSFLVPGDQDFSCFYNVFNVSNIYMCLGGILDINWGSIIRVGSINISNATIANLNITGNINMNGGNITNVGWINATNATIANLNMTGNINMNWKNILNVGWINISNATIANPNMTGDMNMNCNAINNVSNLTMCPNCSKGGGWITNTNTITGCSDNVRIGSSNIDSHLLTSSNDLFISGKLEIEGVSYHDNISYFSDFTYFYNHGQFADDKELRFGNSTDSTIDWSTSQTENTMIWALGSPSNSLIFVPVSNNNSNFTRVAQNNPTTFWHSKNAPTTNTTMAQWGSIGMRDDVREYEFSIDSGTDNITLKDNTMVEGNLTIGDTIGVTMMDMYYNGTEFIIDGWLINTTFTGDVTIRGTLYGGSPLKIGNGINITGDGLYLPTDNFPTCSSSVRGNIQYNTSSNKIMYCNTTEWVTMS